MPTIKLSRSQLMALRSLVAEHLLCPRRSELFIDCSQRPSVDTTPEELLALLMNAPREDTPPPSPFPANREIREGD